MGSQTAQQSLIRVSGTVLLVFGMVRVKYGTVQIKNNPLMTKPLRRVVL